MAVVGSQVVEVETLTVFFFFGGGEGKSPEIPTTDEVNTVNLCT